MTKLEFLESLSQELKHKNVTDFEDIVEEYEQHFAFKMDDGYSEEEIAARLGDPENIALQYEPAAKGRNERKNVISIIGLGITDFFFGILCVLLYAWEIVMIALVVSFGAATAALFTGVRESLIVYVPEMPYHCAFILGIAFAALTILSAAGTVYFFAFIRQLMRSFGRFHKNALAAASGKAILPSLPVYPQLAGKSKRMLRKAALISIIVFVVCFIVGFITCMAAAGCFEFWHVWGWFGYAG